MGRLVTADCNIETKRAPTATGASAVQLRVALGWGDWLLPTATLRRSAPQLPRGLARCSWGSLWDPAKKPPRGAAGGCWGHVSGLRSEQLLLSTPRGGRGPALIISFTTILVLRPARPLVRLISCCSAPPLRLVQLPPFAPRPPRTVGVQSAHRAPPRQGAAPPDATANVA